MFGIKTYCFSQTCFGMNGFANCDIFQWQGLVISCFLKKTDDMQLWVKKRGIKVADLENGLEIITLNGA